MYLDLFGWTALQLVQLFSQGLIKIALDFFWISRLSPVICQQDEEFNIFASLSIMSLLVKGCRTTCIGTG